MQRILLKNKKAMIGKWFAIVTGICLLVGVYIKDYKTALVIFFVYVIIRIILNFIFPKKQDEYYY